MHIGVPGGTRGHVSLPLVLETKQTRQRKNKRWKRVVIRGKVKIISRFDYLLHPPLLIKSLFLCISSSVLNGAPPFLKYVVPLNVWAHAMLLIIGS